MFKIFVIWLFVRFEKSSFKVSLTSIRALTDQSIPVDLEGGGGGGGTEKNSGIGGGGGGGEIKRSLINVAFRT